MIAVRIAIGRASKHPWLWVFVLLLMATLLVFVALHGVEHALEGGDVLLCMTVASFAVLLVARERVQAAPARVPLARDPPPRFAPAVPARAPALHSAPLRL